MLVVNESRPAADVFLHEFFESRLVNGDAAGLEQFDLGRVIVHAGDVVADLGETSARDQTNVAGADDGKLHTQGLPAADIADADLVLNSIARIPASDADTLPGLDRAMFS